MAKVIITGGTGLVGRQLTAMLREKGHEIAILTRNPKELWEYKWDISKRYIDSTIFDNAHIIIHLAGENVGDKPWTYPRKKEIRGSRSSSATLLYDYLKEFPHTIKTFISASAVGYYGDGQEKILTEDAANGTGFLAEVCREWEASADQISKLGIRVCKLRIGVVLSAEGGALPKMDLPVKFGLGAYFGNGRQYVPWIHIKDVCRMFVHLMESPNTRGAYNVCAPDPATNKELTRSIAHVLHRPFIPLPVPAFVLQTLLGERAQLLLMSNRCSSEKIQQTGFQFSYTELEIALQDIYQNK